MLAEIAMKTKIAPLEPVTDGQNGMRTPTGRFAPGNKCGKGNPHVRKLSAMRQAFAEVIDESRLRNLAENIYQRSLAGDMVAAKLLMSYVVGKPVEAVNPDKLDLEEWQLLQQSPTYSELMAYLGFTVSPAIATDVISNDQPTSVKSQMERVIESLDKQVGPDLVQCLGSVRNHRHHRKAK